MFFYYLQFLLLKPTLQILLLPSPGSYTISIDLCKCFYFCTDLLNQGSPGLGSPGIGSWTPPFLHIHYITGSHYTGTWFLLPFLRWWHTALSLISTRWSNGSCTDLRLPGRHLGMDERTSSTAQPGKDWASCLPCYSNSTAWLHDSVRFINNYPISFGQKSWCNLWWPADLQRAHCKDCLILQVCSYTTSERSGPFWQSMLHNFCPGPCHF